MVTMDCNFTSLPYATTGYFSSIILDYLEKSSALQPYYNLPVSLEGIEAAIKQRRKFPTDRELLVSELRKQYEQLPVSPTQANIELLLKENTFTVTTAHQPVIFTGTLYFIYKIFHTIKMCSELRSKFPENNFVPVFYMGCEDADLDELGTFFLDGEKLVWETDQTGAVGRMQVKGLEKLLFRIEGELGIHPFGKNLMKILRDAYKNGDNIQTATLKLVHSIFGAYGLVIVIPDNANLKRRMLPVLEEELFRQTSSMIVQNTIDGLSKHYKIQANPREINLFYLKDNIRERIEKKDNKWRVLNTHIEFDEADLRKELHEHPERFSPNVILRGLYQETILPNLAFIGGGGEMAYWLELKDLFNHHGVPYPMLVLRNSFLIIEKKWKTQMDKIGLDIPSLFKNEDELFSSLVKQESSNQLNLSAEISQASAYYDHLRNVASNVDDSLVQHVSALQARALKPLQQLEKKLLRAEKRKYESGLRHLRAIREHLFPNNNLQERIDNFMPYYAKWGEEFLQTIYKYSSSFEQEFGVLIEK
jgi:bacillithiol synthase